MRLQNHLNYIVNNIPVQEIELSEIDELSNGIVVKEYFNDNYQIEIDNESIDGKDYFLEFDIHIIRRYENQIIDYLDVNIKKVWFYEEILELNEEQTNVLIKAIKEQLQY